MGIHSNLYQRERRTHTARHTRASIYRAECKRLRNHIYSYFWKPLTDRTDGQTYVWKTERQERDREVTRRSWRIPGHRAVEQDNPHRHTANMQTHTYCLSRAQHKRDKTCYPECFNLTITSCKLFCLFLTLHNSIVPHRTSSTDKSRVLLLLLLYLSPTSTTFCMQPPSVGARRRKGGFDLATLKPFESKLAVSCLKVYVLYVPLWPEHSSLLIMFPWKVKSSSLTCMLFLSIWPKINFLFFFLSGCHFLSTFYTRKQRGYRSRPHQLAAGHTGNQLGSLAAQDESSQIKEHTHHRQQDKHIDLEMEG